MPIFLFINTNGFKVDRYKKYICLLFWKEDVPALRDEVTSTCTYNPEAGPLL